MATKFYVEGDKSKAICEACKAVHSTTFKYRDVPFSDGTGGTVNILAGVCDQCGDVAQIPAQATPAIERARSKATEPVEALLPAPYLEMLDLACYKIDSHRALDFRKPLLMFYVHRIVTGLLKPARLLEALARAEPRLDPKGGATRRLSLKVSSQMDEELATVAELMSLKKTDVLRAVMAEIGEDIVEERKPQLLKQIKEFSALATA